MFSIFKKAESEAVLQDLNEEQLSEVAGGVDRDSHERREEHRHRHHHMHHHMHHQWTHNTHNTRMTNSSSTMKSHW